MIMSVVMITQTSSKQYTLFRKYQFFWFANFAGIPIGLTTKHSIASYEDYGFVLFASDMLVSLSTKSCSPIDLAIEINSL